MRTLLQWIVTTVGVVAALYVVPGIYAIGSTWTSAFIFAIVLSTLNTFIRPILKLISLPITILTLGFSSFIINAFMLLLASFISRSLFHSGLVIEGFIPAAIGSVVISLVSMVLSAAIRRA